MKRKLILIIRGFYIRSINMAGVSATEGAKNTATTKQASNTTRAKTKEKAPNSVVKKKQATTQAQVPKEPKKKEITITLGSGDSLFALAMKYNVSVDEICKLNGIKDPNKVKIDQKIKIMAYDPKEKAEWDTYQYELAEQKRAVEMAKAKEKRIALAQAKIQEAKANGREDDYSFSMDKDGYVIVTLKTNKKLHDIREEMGQNPGKLDEMNNFEGRYGQIPILKTDSRDIETWDNYEAKKGESFRIDTDQMHTSKTLKQRLKDWWPF